MPQLLALDKGCTVASVVVGEEVEVVVGHSYNSRSWGSWGNPHNPVLAAVDTGVVGYSPPDLDLFLCHGRVLCFDRPVQALSDTEDHCAILEN